MVKGTEDDKDLKARVLAELEDARAFAKTLDVAELKEGQWFLKLLYKVTSAYNRNARAEYFQKKYPGVPRDDIADVLVSVATRYAAIVGAVTGVAVTAGVVAVTASGGVAAAALVGAIGAEMLTLAGLQMRLVLDMSVVYDLQLDPEDPEDILMVFGYALGVAPADLLGRGVQVSAGVATKGAVKKYVSKGTLKTVQRIGQKLGVKILQRTLIKYAVPVASASIGSAYNYATTKSVGEIAKRHLKNKGKVTDELRAVVSKRNAYDLVVPAAVMFTAQADGSVTQKETEMYRAMLSRMSFEEHAPEGFERWMGDKDGVLAAVAEIEDRDTAVALVELITLMAIYDGALVPEEREWLTCVAESACVPLDLDEVERRAKEYEVVVRDDVLRKAAGVASEVVTRTAGSTGRASRRLKGLMNRTRKDPDA